MSFIGDAFGGVFDALGMGPKSGQINPKYNASGGHPGDYAYNAFMPAPVTIGQNPNGSMMNIPGTSDYDPSQGGSRVQYAPAGGFGAFSAPFMQNAFGKAAQVGQNVATQYASAQRGTPTNYPQRMANGGSVYDPQGRQMMADGGAPVFYAPTNSFNATPNIASASQGSASLASAAQSGFNAQAVKDNFNAQAIKNGFVANPIVDQFQAQNQQSDYNVAAPTNAYQAKQAAIDTSNYQNLINTAQGQSAGGAGPTQGTLAQMQGLGETLQQQMAGNGPSLAQLQLQAALDQNASQSASMIGGQKGINAGLAARGIMGQTAAANQAAVNQSAQIRAQEQLNATNQYQNLLNQQGQMQLGQQQAGTQALATAGGLQNQQGANQIQNLQQQQQLNQATSAQNASMNLQGQLANQQQSMTNAGLRQQAQEVNAQTAALNANLGQAAQQINAQTAAQNADLANSAQQMNWSTSQLNANLANAAQQMNWQTSLSNAQMRTQVNLENASNLTNVSMGNAQMRTNVGLANQQSQNYAMGLNATVAQGNQASQLATNSLNQNTAVSQAGLNLQYQQMLGAIASQNAGLAGQAQGINAGIGVNNANNQQAWGNGLLGMGAGLGGAAIMASDERVKTHIRRSKTKEALPGVPEATFRYRGSDKQYKGVIAQDVERVRPDLVYNVGGIKMVPAALGPRRQMAAGGGIDPMEGMSFIQGMMGNSSNPMMQSFMRAFGMATAFQKHNLQKQDPFGIGMPDPSPSSLIAQNTMAAPGTGEMFANGGFAGQVPGVPNYPGQDTLKNDTVPADLTPGEIVLPLSVTSRPDAPAAAAAFVAKTKGQQGYAHGGTVTAPALPHIAAQRRQAFKMLGEARKAERAYFRGGKVK